MKDSKITFAFAVNHANNFEPKHFGDADKYLIYEFINGNFSLVSEQMNEFKTFDEESNHGSKEKGNSIIKLLKSNRVSVLVSQQFGRNIKMVNSHFVPIIIRDDKPEDVFGILAVHLKWLVDELEQNSNGYKLFTINKGIMKTSIQNPVSKN